MQGVLLSPGVLYNAGGGAGRAGCPEQVRLMQAINNYYVAANAVVRGDVVCRAGVNVWFATVIRADLARVTLGPRVNLQDGCVVHTDTDCPQDIEEGVVVGHAAVLHGRTIGRDSLVGIGARLLAGSEVGPECIIAAGAIVTEGRRIPPRSVVMGIPGRIVRPVTDEEVERTRTICAHYLEMAQRYTRGAYPPPWLR
ncbi:MAG: gamma carbonic anhydrase family protein [Gemmataceae bacterium]|nr:gamma carbonic anhydrase family protein [Gemmataceae bacterium]